MSMLEFIHIVLGLVFTAAFILFPLVIYAVKPIVLRALYYLACYMTNSINEYDTNGDYIPAHK